MSNPQKSAIILLLSEVNDMKILCIVAYGFEELEAIGSIALLRRAGIEVDVFALQAYEATGRFDITMGNLGTLQDAKIEAYDLLLLPGGPHYQALEASALVMNILDTFYAQNKKIAAICAAPTILGRRGLLKGKNYTCFTSMNDEFGGTYLDQYAVVDGNLITGRSAAAVIAFAFAIIEVVLGKEACEKVKASIYY